MFKNLKILIIFGIVIFCSFQLFSQEDRIVVTRKETYLLPLENHFRVSGNTLLFSINMRIGDKIVITNLKGKKIMGYIQEVDISKIILPKITNGVYLVNQIRDGTVIQTDRIVIVESCK